MDVRETLIELMSESEETTLNEWERTNLSIYCNKLIESGKSNEQIVVFYELLKDWIDDYSPDENEVEDLVINNWGIATREGKKFLVIVDYGLNDSIYEDYYLCDQPTFRTFTN